MLQEAIISLGEGALDKQQVGFGKAAPAQVEERIRPSPPSTQQRIDEIAPENRANLCDLTRGAEPVEPRGERLLQGRRDGLYAALRATLHQQPSHFLNKQRHAACALVDPLDQLFGQCMAGRDFADHARDAGSIQRGQRNQAVMRTQAPRRAELRTGCSQHE